MNFLAHAYLSFGHEEILVGNMISDFVKGKQKATYSTGIHNGIILHRSIDEFTDNHPATKEAKKIFKHAVGRYSGAFADVVYDHFLANDTNEFINNEALKKFTTTIYYKLQDHYPELPHRFQLILPSMQANDWLFNYKYRWGIEKSFGGVVRRAVYLSDAGKAFQAFENEHQLLKEIYSSFFPDIKKYALNQLELLEKDNSQNTHWT